ncbi:hypothetical protein BACCIP111895_04693 [Neobacillus rhizosphaerae]|uniref:Uncharacterized protein n=1 Tax=Neobacillus rhizosphaerae TaxID=2880965 RepID=A0ABN8KUT6_9BACI|nr:hypothetical protein [Neobacillus rhizosphaerae]CAH2717479.1 hypothetical protein BACCIP111895_04693 [Neobacillus rhizosphaerae]
MKKTKIYSSILIVIILALVIIYKANIINTTSYITILDKGNDGRNYWVVVVNPFDSVKKKFKINIDSKTTWNLIKINEKYLATYEYISIERNVNLVDIQYGFLSQTKPK